MASNGGRHPTGCGHLTAAGKHYTSTTSSICGRISGDVAMPQAMWVMVRYADDIVIGFRQTIRCPALPYSHAAQTEGVRTHGSPGKKTRLMEFGRFRCRKPCHQGKRQTRNVQLPRVHAHQRERSQRQVMLIRKTRRGSDDGNSEKPSKTVCEGAGITQSPNRENGSGEWFRDT